MLQGRRDEVVLATKFGKEMGDGAERRGSRDYIRAALAASAVLLLLVSQRFTASDPARTALGTAAERGSSSCSVRAT